jgi:hypothetical protein
MLFGSSSTSSDCLWFGGSRCTDNASPRIHPTRCEEGESIAFSLLHMLRIRTRNNTRQRTLDISRYRRSTMVIIKYMYMCTHVYNIIIDTIELATIIINAFVNMQVCACAYISIIVACVY